MSCACNPNQNNLLETNEKNNYLENLSNYQIINTNQNEKNSNKSKESEFNKDLPEIIFQNFIYEIGSYLLKSEKINLRILQKSISENIFPLYKTQINIKSKIVEDGKNPKKEINPEKFFQNFCSVEKINIENKQLDDSLLNQLISIFKINSKKIKSLSLANIDYFNLENIQKFKKILFSLENLEEIKIKNIGNKDLLVTEFQEIFEEKISLDFFERIKNLKIDNIPLEQIIFLTNSFTNFTKISIEHCCLDEDLKYIEKILNRKKEKENLENLKYLNLSFNGLSSAIALNSLKKILAFHNKISTILLRGMWFPDIYSLNEEFRLMENLTSLDLTGSKNIFDGQNSVFAFCEIKNLKILNLGDSRMKDNNLFSLLQTFDAKKNTSLEELNFFRCLLTDDSIENILKFSKTLINLKILNMTFNHGVSEKGFNKLLEKINLLPSLKNLNLRNTGICVKYSLKNILSFIINLAGLKLIDKNSAQISIKKVNKDENSKVDCDKFLENYNGFNLEFIDLSFCTIYDNDYFSLINDTLNNLNTYFTPGYLNLKISLKIYNRKKAIFQKVEKPQTELYKNYNLNIR